LNTTRIFETFKNSSWKVERFMEEYYDTPSQYLNQNNWISIRKNIFGPKGKDYSCKMIIHNNEDLVYFQINIKNVIEMICGYDEKQWKLIARFICVRLTIFQSDEVSLYIDCIKIKPNEYYTVGGVTGNFQSEEKIENILNQIRNDIVSMSRSKIVEYLYHNEKSLFDLLQENNVIISTEAYDHKVGLSTNPLLPWIKSSCMFFGTVEYLKMNGLNPLDSENWNISEYILSILEDLTVKVEEEKDCISNVFHPLTELIRAWSIFSETNFYSTKSEGFKKFVDELMEKFL